MKTFTSCPCLLLDFPLPIDFSCVLTDREGSSGFVPSVHQGKLARTMKRMLRPVRVNCTSRPITASGRPKAVMKGRYCQEELSLQPAQGTALLWVVQG